MRCLGELHARGVDFLAMNRNAVRRDDSQLDAVALDAHDFHADAAVDHDLFAKFAGKDEHERPSMVVAKSNSFFPLTQNRCRWFFSSSRHRHPIIAAKSIGGLELLKLRHKTTHAHPLRVTWYWRNLLTYKLMRRNNHGTK